MKSLSKKIAHGFLICIMILFKSINIASAEVPFDVDGKSALLMDSDTGTIIYEKNIYEELPMASITKIMTVLLTLEAIDEGKLGLDDTVTISEYAASMGGSQVFLSPGENIPVHALLKSVIVASANDGSVALAEKISGSHDMFVKKMNERAKALGMNNTNFENCSGLPAENHYSSAYDIAIMSRELLKHPSFFKWSTIWYDTLEEAENKTELTNTNRLVRFYDGCDGIKTGSTQEAKFCLSATAKRGNLRWISVIMAAPSAKVRFEEAAKLMDYGFANYESIPILKKDQVIEKDIFISGGKESKIDGLVSRDLSLLVKKEENKDFEQIVNIEQELKAPIAKGDVIGSITILRGGKELDKIDVLSDRDVQKAGIFDYFSRTFSEWAGRYR